MVLSDIGIDADGSLSDPASGGELGTLFGREGNVVLVNGRIAPTIVSRIGRRQRWRIVNTAKTRYFQEYALEGHRFVRIGGDGAEEARHRIGFDAVRRIRRRIAPSDLARSPSDRG